MYFKKPGKKNTKRVLEIVKEVVKERGIKHIVVASCGGYTAQLFQQAKLGVNLVCVTHMSGFRNPGEMEMPEDVKKQLIKSGVKVLTTTHVLSGADRGISRKFGGTYPVEIIAHTLRMFGQGVKVCVEICVMALDAGLIPHNEIVIAVGGSIKGADTAIILKPAHASSIFDTSILEILCKPANKWYKKA